MLNIAMLAQTADVDSFLAGFDSEQRFILTIVSIVFATGLVLVLLAIGAGIWRSVKEKQIEADLKRDMLDRGMTAEEIEKVISAAPQSSFDRWLNSWCKK